MSLASSRQSYLLPVDSVQRLLQTTALVAETTSSPATSCEDRKSIWLLNKAPAMKAHTRIQSIICKQIWQVVRVGVLCMTIGRNQHADHVAKYRNCIHCCSPVLQQTSKRSVDASLAIELHLCNQILLKYCNLWATTSLCELNTQQSVVLSC